MDKKALKSNAETENFHILWLCESANQFIRAKVINLLFRALIADNIWKAMEYLMAARGLLGDLKTSDEHVNPSPITTSKSNC